LALMRRLRDPINGCPWDRQQDARSLAPFTLEEAYEVVAAIELGEPLALRDELGDLLFQVVFLAQLSAEKGEFDFEDVARGITDKLTHRHPHVFKAQSGVDNLSWESIKAEERRTRGVTSVLGDVPTALPALSRAAKLGRRAASVGFDWTDLGGVKAKILEELQEVDNALTSANSDEVESELGDLLLAVTSLARHLRVDPETALRRANTKFERRFRRMEEIALEQGRQLAAMGPDQLDQLWNEAKKGVQS
jgi:MazG family protein